MHTRDIYLEISIWDIRMFCFHNFTPGGPRSNASEREVLGIPLHYPEPHPVLGWLDWEAPLAAYLNSLGCWAIDHNAQIEYA